MFPITEAWDGYEINDAVLEEYNQAMEMTGKYIAKKVGKGLLRGSAAVGAGAAIGHGVASLTGDNISGAVVGYGLGVKDGADTLVKSLKVGAKGLRRYVKNDKQNRATVHA